LMRFVRNAHAAWWPAAFVCPWITIISRPTARLVRGTQEGRRTVGSEKYLPHDDAACPAL
jgi:hypothetical protein